MLSNMASNNSSNGRGRHITHRTRSNKGQPGRSLGYDQRRHRENSDNATTERVMYFRTLQSIADQEPDELLQLIVNRRKGFLALLESKDLSDDVISLVVQIICRACESHVIPKSRLKLLNEIRTSGFLTSQLSSYITGLGTRRDSSCSMSLGDFLNYCIILLENILRSFPSSLPDVMVVYGTIEMYHKRMKSMLLAPRFDPDMAEKLDNLQKIINKMTNDSKKQQRQAKSSREDKATPPNDFREIPIFPQIDDIYLSEKPFLRVNKNTGGYQDLDHYLDVQFRLLREDFIAPLREGIGEYAEAQSLGEETKRIQDIKLYFDVHIKHSLCTEEAGLVHCIQFSIEPLKRVKWERSKRLTYGSLLCLSSNNFQTMLFASVIDRHPEKLEQGILHVKFELDNDIIASIKSEETFVMAESSAYFEAYKHVLKGLQWITDELPFQDYIVHCENEVQPPKYLTDRLTVHYDFTPIMDPEYTKSLCDNSVDKLIAVYDEYEIDIESIIKKHSFEEIPVLDYHVWPSKEQLQLDQSQMQALKAALTKEFVVIQGPPGTGKTYVGLKIAHILLHNRVLWSPENDHPMLVVCYTNHALDQFLEGIVQVSSTNVIRIGGRSQNEKLEEYNIKSIRKLEQYKNLVPPLVRQGLGDGYETIRWLGELLTKKIAALKAAEIGIIHERRLEENISNQHFWQLTRKVPPGFRVWQQEGYRSMMLEWLGLGSVKLQLPHCRSGITYTHELNTNKQQKVRNTVKPPEYVDIAEDAEAVESARKLDEESYQGVKGAMEKYDQIGPDEDGLEITIEQLDRPYHYLDKHKIWVFDRKEMYQRYQLLVSEMRKREHTDSEEYIWKLSVENRWKLYRFWIGKYKAKLREEIKNIEQQYQVEQERLAELKQQRDLEIMRQAKVIGMTTTGAATYWHVLQQIQPKIIIVEEAAEVLESHIVTTLSPGCEHLILIGDHKQLKPNPTVYQLAKKYHLDLSLFERMVNNGLQCNTLEIQHRMRPEIAALIHPIYPDLKNHDSVMQYEDINGVGSNLFFIDHREDETEHDENKSRSNEHEAEYIAALCKYLLQQGYASEQITVLTTYSGQLFAIRNLMPKSEFSGVRICVVDNYQGEENDIILLSLVRSNKENVIGFLKTENRVCVSLSRAKKGFYIVGNLNLLANQADLWSDILQILRKQNCVGSSLELFCRNHPDKKIHAVTAADFQKAPSGGCLEPCQFRLDCGHVCDLTCHILDAEHMKYQCRKPCHKRCEKGHLCSKQCSQPCGQCDTLVFKECPKCELSISVPCFFEFDDEDPSYDIYKCKRTCRKIHCNKGHACPKKCFEDCETTCYKMVDKRDPNCGHVNSVPCHFEFDRSDTYFEIYQCNQECGRSCRAGHNCNKKCWEKCQCETLVEKNCPKCDYKQTVPCYFSFLSTDDAFEEYKCRQPCSKTLCEQGHPCPKQCWSDCDSSCSYMVEKKNPNCQHKYKVPCNFVFTLITHNEEGEGSILQGYNKCRNMIERRNPDCHHMNLVPCYTTFESEKKKQSRQVACKEKCSEILQCGHKCSGNCGDCMQGKLHMPCLLPCEKILLCGHKCSGSCSQSCPPCQELCQNKCSHGKCKHKCGFECVSCKQPCQWKCKHEKCKLPCSEPCTREPCKEACGKKLKCKHSCIGFCGENCPDICRICNKKKVETILDGRGDVKDSRFVKLADCGHIFESTYLDEWMDTEANNNTIQPPQCPKCMKQIKQSLRYGKYVRSFQKNVELVKKKMLETRGHHSMAQKKLLQDIETEKESHPSGGLRWLSSKLEGNLCTSELIEMYRTIFNVFLQLGKVRRIRRLNEDDNYFKLIDWCQRERKWISAQELEEVNQEIDCLASSTARMMGLHTIYRVERVTVTAKPGFFKGVWRLCAQGKHIIVSQNDFLYEQVYQIKDND